jgi:hypothetical protein
MGVRKLEPHELAKLPPDTYERNGYTVWVADNKNAEVWDRGTYPACAEHVTRNPVPKFSTIEQMLKRREWKGATVGVVERRTYTVRFTVRDGEATYHATDAEFADWRARNPRARREDGPYQGQDAIELTEEVDVIPVRHPSGCVVYIRTVTGEALVALRRAQWAEREAQRREAANETARRERERREREEAAAKRLAPYRDAATTARVAHRSAADARSAVARLEAELERARAVSAAAAESYERARTYADKLANELGLEPHEREAY